ncbi:S8 family peptidase [Undibacterium jejuense]|uniref:S8 family peptidase n=1 Tax=Undibacterium jejuense TaxID=1344949 RepID=A0A923KHL3_9BURK|nr:S8 family peptidase [Undibacterium jejuense]MBC3861102.1 S8 family peptidase [Undibacterium jejuense]
MTPAFAYVTATNKNGNTQAQVEQNLTQLIVKYRNDINTNAATTSVGTGKSGITQVQIQRLSALQSVAQSFGASFEIKRQIVTGGWVYRSSVALKPSQMRALAAKLAQSDKTIDYAEPDYIRHALYVPTDPLYATAQWDMQSSATQPGGLNLPAAWDLSLGKGMVVAVLDTGYRPHPDILPNLVPAQNGAAGQYGYNFISDPVTARLTLSAGTTSARGYDALDQGDWVPTGDTVCPSQAGKNSSWHGTHVAGTIAAAANSIGVIGVAPSAKVLPLRVLGKCGGSDSDIADAVAWAAGISVNGVPNNTNRANVINLSLGGTGFCTKTSATAFQLAMANGTAIVVAAGNESIDAKLSSPANCPGVITVASTSIAGGRSGYSNYGGTVAVAAPGGGFTTAADLITSTLPTGTTVSKDDTTYGTMAGTSQATPHVAGIVALMLAVKPSLTPAQIKSILISTARPAPANCPACGSGIVDAAAAVKAAAGS